MGAGPEVTVLSERRFDSTLHVLGVGLVLSCVLLAACSAPPDPTAKTFSDASEDRDGGDDSGTRGGDHAHPGLDAGALQGDAGLASPLDASMAARDMTLSHRVPDLARTVTPPP